MSFYGKSFHKEGRRIGEIGRSAAVVNSIRNQKLVWVDLSAPFFCSFIIKIFIILQRCLPVLVFYGLRTKIGGNIKKKNEVPCIIWDLELKI